MTATRTADLKLRYSEIIDPDDRYSCAQEVPQAGSIVYVVRREKLAGAIGYQLGGGNVSYYICAEPQRTNSSREERIFGWLGTNDNVEHFALGRFQVVGGSSTHAWFRRLPDDE